MVKLIQQEILGEKNMGALFKFCCVVFCCFSLASCVNGVGMPECRYKFTDDEMVNKFKMAMSNSPEDMEIYSSTNGRFGVKRLNCNYYVTFNLVPMKIDGRALLIFDNAGEVVSSSVR
jgi:hypothetical protein